MSETSILPITITPWRGGKHWVYSITFDEALIDLHEFAVPILDEYNCPGHLEVVVGQMGGVRQLFQSTYNGMRHMNAQELRTMLQMGWGVGNHSWSHTYLNLANIDRELDEAKRVLEDVLGVPISIYCAPGSNANMSDEILEACKELGYLGAMGICESLNRSNDKDLMWLNRVYLHDNGPITHDAEFDPYRKIQHAMYDEGWIIDYCHCPMEQALHPRKDCSAEQLRQRLNAVKEFGEDDVWLGRIEEVVNYRYARRALQIHETNIRDEFDLSFVNLPAAVSDCTITVQLPGNTSTIDLDGTPGDIYRHKDQVLVDVDVNQVKKIRISRKND